MQGMEERMTTDHEMTTEQNELSNAYRVDVLIILPPLADCMK